MVPTMPSTVLGTGRPPANVITAKWRCWQGLRGTGSVFQGCPEKAIPKLSTFWSENLKTSFTNAALSSALSWPFTQHFWASCRPRTCHLSNILAATPSIISKKGKSHESRSNNKPCSAIHQTWAPPGEARCFSAFLLATSYILGSSQYILLRL